ncbi:PGL/p-HBAD biosynthesis rhamnosyltransferase [Candidatus Propionivibrio aalborgensis]|uniref:PGL/p-HBAD biosynthesis rhamnosyltransferase n=1 Tax=Candidatus Propionivibrio aalborgensis TaxID=1860101 RepID=A0A1A8XU40_9RHOO|nr:glycosyltransferase [Candidatus Propionivibrio aalborgensis]SBT08067.1 PGL/p-HBAD biosynthesis rhamnosyltransferase [Candidatus Propionivibrio aalborgensis]
MKARPTILFVADAVTLAHLARPAALAQRLDAEKFDVILACDSRYKAFLDHLPFPTRHLGSMSSERFLESAAKGRPLYDTRTLRNYVRDDLALLQSVQPEAVVGDHRLSLSTSARVAGVPYLGVINAYWSPYTATRSLPLPELPFNRWLGTSLAESLFRLVWPLASAYHALPLNRVRRDYGLPSLGNDWFSAYTDADRTLYADAIELVPTQALPSTHSYLGPILWSPAVALPPWWDDLPTDRPVIYATMGSSGRPDLLELVLKALADLPVTVVATTAAKPLQAAPPNARLIDYAPGDQLAARADMMICNGGSLTVYQSLAAGKPLLGIASHMDQHLSMSYVEKAGVGTLLRSEELTSTKLRETVHQLLANDLAQRRAQALAISIAAYAPAERLGKILEEITARVKH